MFFQIYLRICHYYVKTENHTKLANPPKLNKHTTINQFCTSRPHALCFKRNATCIGCHCLALQETSFHNQRMRFQQHKSSLAALYFIISPPISFCWGEMNTKARHSTYLRLSSILLCLMKNKSFDC